jgi:16S rRNA (guanine527-N7)-methyltransferase
LPILSGKLSIMGANTGHRRAFSAAEIEAGVAPMLLQPLSAAAYSLLGRYLQLLHHWNQKINLTAVRDPDVLVRLHLAECLRAAQTIPPEVETVLDFGSGAGFPGIPIQIARQELQVTLAESQKKKAAFLRAAVRELGLSGASIYAGRVEEMPVLAVFDLVTLRAVDKMAEAMQAAFPRIRPPHGARLGQCMVLTSLSEVPAILAASGLAERTSAVRMDWLPPEPVPGTNQRVILLGSRIR